LVADRQKRARNLSAQQTGTTKRNNLTTYRDASQHTNNNHTLANPRPHNNSRQCRDGTQQSATHSAKPVQTENSDDVELYLRCVGLESAVIGASPMGSACSWPRIVPIDDAPPRSRTSHCATTRCQLFLLFFVVQAKASPTMPTMTLDATRGGGCSCCSAAGRGLREEEEL
jgi:hypothetical protein